MVCVFHLFVLFLDGTSGKCLLLVLEFKSRSNLPHIFTTAATVTCGPWRKASEIETCEWCDTLVIHKTIHESIRDTRYACDTRKGIEEYNENLMWFFNFVPILLLSFFSFVAWFLFRFQNFFFALVIHWATLIRCTYMRKSLINFCFNWT